MRLFAHVLNELFPNLFLKEVLKNYFIVFIKV